MLVGGIGFAASLVKAPLDGVYLSGPVDEGGEVATAIRTDADSGHAESVYVRGQWRIDLAEVRQPVRY